MSPSDDSGAAVASVTRPVEVPASGPRDRFRTCWRVHAVIPAFNRHGDVDRLLGDLGALAVGPAELRVVVVDNASDPPLTPTVPPDCAVEVYRQACNLGGSGGFNAGMQLVLRDPPPDDIEEAIWLLDSDVRLEPDTLRPLLTVLEHDASIAAAGSVLVDPEGGEAFEAGGRVNPRTGELEQPWPDNLSRLVATGPGRVPVVEAQYVAACSLLVRRRVVEQAGLMADLFLCGDDVEWCERIRRRTGLRIVAVPASRVRHMRPDRMRTAARYYAARNAFTVIDAAVPPRQRRRARFVRALRETGRALAQVMLGRDDLAELHLRGLTHAVRGVTGPAPPATIEYVPFRPLSALPEAVRGAFPRRPPLHVLIQPDIDTPVVRAAIHEALAGRVRMSSQRSRAGPVGRWPAGAEWWAWGVRLMVGPRADLAVVSARGRPRDWLAGRTIVSVAPEGFVLRRVTVAGRWWRLTRFAARGLWLAGRLACQSPRRVSCAGSAFPVVRPMRPARPGLSVLILTHNRVAMLRRTLEALGRDPAARGAQIIVVDNASRDGTVEMTRRRFPEARVVALPENVGVGGFNAARIWADREMLLVLDDDAVPAPGVLARALALLARRHDLAAVALHPVHPATGVSEWPFALAGPPTDRFPLLGCANLVRAADWDAAGGYDPDFFLYRNDTDLALKLLAMGRGVYHDPAWHVWHDSPGAGRKSSRWFRLATRNWCWLCRRHGRGLTAWSAVALGWVHAHRLAGLDPRAHASVLAGVWSGLRESPPPLLLDTARRGSGLRTLLALRLNKTIPNTLGTPLRQAPKPPSRS